MYVDGWPRKTLDVEDGTTAFQLPPGPPVPHTLELRGFDGGELVAATRVEL